MVKEVVGSYKFKYHPVEDDPDKVFEVDFTPPFKRVYMIPELESKLQVKFPAPSEFAKPGLLVQPPIFPSVNVKEKSHLKLSLIQSLSLSTIPPAPASQSPLPYPLVLFVCCCFIFCCSFHLQSLQSFWMTFAESITWNAAIQEQLPGCWIR